jgi:hypothetical protein
MTKNEAIEALRHMMNGLEIRDIDDMTPSQIDDEDMDMASVLYKVITSLEGDATTTTTASDPKPTKVRKTYDKKRSALQLELNAEVDRLNHYMDQVDDALTNLCAVKDEIEDITASLMDGTTKRND